MPSDVHEPESLLLRLEGFEGPLDLLLDLARAQKVDLAKISILALVEQYLILIECAGEAEQVELLQRFQGEGLKCKALVS